MKKLIAFALATGLLAACGGSNNSSPAYGVFGTASVAPVSQQAAQIGLTGPDAEPVAAAVLVAGEVDSLNPASTVTVSAQSADAEPLPLSALPATAVDTNKPNS